MSIGIITSIKSIKEIIWPNFLTYQKYYDLCRSKVTAPKFIYTAPQDKNVLILCGILLQKADLGSFY